MGRYLLPRREMRNGSEIFGCLDFRGRESRSEVTAVQFVLICRFGLCDRGVCPLMFWCFYTCRNVPFNSNHTILFSLIELIPFLAFVLWRQKSYQLTPQHVLLIVFNRSINWVHNSCIYFLQEFLWFGNGDMWRNLLEALSTGSSFFSFSDFFYSSWIIFCVNEVWQCI